LSRGGTAPTAPSTAYKEVKNKEMVRKYFCLFNQHNIEKMGELISPKHRFYIAQNPPLDWTGHKLLLSSVYYKAFPDMQLNIEDMTAGGSNIIVRMTITGTHKGVFEGKRPTGKRFSVGALLILHIDDDDGKIAEEWIVLNPFELMHNLALGN
jgi:predicted ester cyclase